MTETSAQPCAEAISLSYGGRDYIVHLDRLTGPPEPPEPAAYGITITAPTGRWRRSSTWKTDESDPRSVAHRALQEFMIHGPQGRPDWSLMADAPAGMAASYVARGTDGTTEWSMTFRPRTGTDGPLSYDVEASVPGVGRFASVEPYAPRPGSEETFDTVARWMARAVIGQTRGVQGAAPVGWRRVTLPSDPPQQLAGPATGCVRVRVPYQDAAWTASFFPITEAGALRSHNVELTRRDGARFRRPYPCLVGGPADPSYTEVGLSLVKELIEGTVPWERMSGDDSRPAPAVDVPPSPAVDEPPEPAIDAPPSPAVDQPDGAQPEIVQRKGERFVVSLVPLARSDADTEYQAVLRREQRPGVWYRVPPWVAPSRRARAAVARDVVDTFISFAGGYEVWRDLELERAVVILPPAPRRLLRLGRLCIDWLREPASGGGA